MNKILVDVTISREIADARNAVVEVVRKTMADLLLCMDEKDPLHSGEETAQMLLDALDELIGCTANYTATQLLDGLERAGTITAPKNTLPIQ